MKKERRFYRDRMKKGIFILPNLITTIGLFAGFSAIVSAMNGRYEMAAILVFVAAGLDAVDGRIARLTKTTSKFGAEYDSLSDLVAFGVAPAILMYMWSLSSYGKWGWLVAFLYVVCGALRLARFNVQIGLIESRVFNGLPIPGAACVLAATVLLYYKLGGEGRFESLSVLAGMFVLSLLMVSSIKYYSFKDLNWLARKPFTSLLVIILVMIVIAAEPQIMVFTFVVGYSLSGPVWYLYRLSRRGVCWMAGKEQEKIESVK
ncbi:MAG: CDP-diacylglycerol--serine O-phosphatidyltransferase [Syntrophales bacterium]|nr:CDP-diacylglycerol--serine O-phosphatidyltransferase [Syntrophales bacterium]